MRNRQGRRAQADQDGEFKNPDCTTLPGRPARGDTPSRIGVRIACASESALVRMLQEEYMPSRLRTSFRSGNLAEHLGLLLLKGIAAVADVPRSEDVGLDAVATLLRRAPDGNCYAEDGFVVQLKSCSATSIQYRDHELSWLISQSQPLFIGRVSLQESRISLYPTLHVNHAVLALHAEQVTIEFGRAKHAGGEQFSWTGEGIGSAIVWLGEPLLEWTVSDLTDATWLSSAYQIMKRFLGIARRERDLLSLGQCSQLEWAKNDKDSIRSSFKMIKSHPDNLQALAERSLPGINALMMHATAMPEEGGNSLMIPLIALVAALRDHGVDVQSSNVFTRMFAAVRHSPKPKR